MHLDYDDLSIDQRADLLRYAHGCIDAGNGMEDALLAIERKFGLVLEKSTEDFLRERLGGYQESRK